MPLALLAILSGFLLLIWSAGKFVSGASATAQHAGLPSLLIGMVIVGFGTSVPEMLVSAMAASEGNTELALGNALGSNIVNTGLIIGVTALIAPIVVDSAIVRRELPILLMIGALFGWLISDGALDRVESLGLLAGFSALICWSVYSALRAGRDGLQSEMEVELQDNKIPLSTAVFWLITGLALLVLSSRILVWGAITVASASGVSSLVIGLTIVALGTSLPELATSVIAALKGEHNIALGNVIGSNMFNLLAVVGLAGVIEPMPEISANILSRDWPVMMVMTFFLLILAFGIPGHGRINRIEGGLLLVSYIAYSSYLAYTISA